MNRSLLIGCSRILGLGHVMKTTSAPTVQGRLLPHCSFYTSTKLRQDAEEAEEPAKQEVNPKKDRSQIIPVEMSIRYLQSSAYKTTYGDDPVWKKYRRNFKGQFAPKKTRKTCIRKNQISTGSPCPICRDEYLVVHYQNVELLKQFISPYTGAILPDSKTNICQKRLRELRVAVEKARDFGLLTFDVPFREYDYSEYYDLQQKKQ
ncbi:small ribosomal subunit protein mS40-like [Macrobrachium nipponense]|uniref:small ribosomal subunit protein mS40-like n=1 Tax=Macrobrachium nipponense TaxID=159736 RepID=UPI0030C7BC18